MTRSRRKARHRRLGQGPPGGVAGPATPTRPGRGQALQGDPLGAAQESVDLNEDQAATLRKLKRRGGDLWRAYTLKEALRAVFAGDLSVEEVGALLDRFCSRASRSGLTLRHRSSDDPQAPRGHPRRRPARNQQRPSRRAESISCPRESSLPVEALGAPWSHLGPAASARSPDWAARITDSKSFVSCHRNAIPV
jgi:hypothetical protein